MEKLHGLPINGACGSSRNWIDTGQPLVSALFWTH